MNFGHTNKNDAVMTAFIRKASRLAVVIQQMEEELKWMRQKALSQVVINKKDLQIEELVTFYNQAEETIQYMKHEMLQLKIENHFLTEMMMKKMELHELMQYKPHGHIMIAKADETDLPQTLSRI